MCEYKGERINTETYQEREYLYDNIKPPAMFKVADNDFIDPYVINGQTVPAAESPGTWLNHSRALCNCKVVPVREGKEIIALAIVTSKAISRGEELVFDYNDRRQGLPQFLRQ